MSLSIDRKISAWVRSWERKGYPNGIPDEAPSNLEEMGRVPSYRIACVAIMRNDMNLVTLGYSRPKSALYNDLKRIEIQQRKAKQ